MVKRVTVKRACKRGNQKKASNCRVFSATGFTVFWKTERTVFAGRLFFSSRRGGGSCSQRKDTIRVIVGKGGTRKQQF
jgi:hypothetical protein